MNNVELTWGKPKIELGKLGADGSAPTSWIEVDNPVENTTKITAAKGDKKEAKEEGGGVVAVRYGETNYTLEFELRAKGGKDKPVEDRDGVIDGNYAVRITPENTTLPGKIMDAVTLFCESNYDTDKGETWKYTGDVLKPASGNKVKPYSPTALVISPTSLVFDSAANTAGKTLTVASEGNLTAATSADSWITPTKAGKVATVKVTANTGTEARTGSVALTADGKTVDVAVTQSGASA